MDARPTQLNNLYGGYRGCAAVSRLSDLETSVSNLMAEAKTSPKLGVLVNLGLALPGIVLALAVNELALQFIGVVWATINLGGIVKWVFQL